MMSEISSEELADIFVKSSVMEVKLENLEVENKRLRDALKETYGWITTLEVNAFGISYTDDKQPFSIRDKILDDIAKALP